MASVASSCRTRREQRRTARVGGAGGAELDEGGGGCPLHVFSGHSPRVLPAPPAPRRAAASVALSVAFGDPLSPPPLLHAPCFCVPVLCTPPLVGTRSQRGGAPASPALGWPLTSPRARESRARAPAARRRRQRYPSRTRVCVCVSVSVVRGVGQIPPLSPSSSSFHVVGRWLPAVPTARRRLGHPSAESLSEAPAHPRKLALDLGKKKRVKEKKKNAEKNAEKTWWRIGVKNAHSM